MQRTITDIKTLEHDGHKGYRVFFTDGREEVWWEDWREIPPSKPDARFGPFG